MGGGSVNGVRPTKEERVKELSRLENICFRGAIGTVVLFITGLVFFSPITDEIGKLPLIIIELLLVFLCVFFLIGANTNLRKKEKIQSKRSY